MKEPWAAARKNKTSSKLDFVFRSPCTIFAVGKKENN